MEKLICRINGEYNGKKLYLINFSGKWLPGNAVICATSEIEAEEILLACSEYQCLKDQNKFEKLDIKEIDKSQNIIFLDVGEY